MSEMEHFLSNPVIGGVASILTILSFLWGCIQSIRVRKLAAQLTQLKFQINVDAGHEQRSIATHDHSTYVETATDVTINHGKD